MSNLLSIASLNPKITLKKGTVAPFIEMASIAVNQKFVKHIQLKKFSSGSKFQNGDILFARITPCLENGKTAKISGLMPDVVAHGSTEFIVIRAKRFEDRDFLYYLARLSEFRDFAKSRMRGTTGRQRVEANDLAEFEFDFPDENSRKKIGNFLSIFDDKIHLNHQINQTLEQMVQAIFKSWFVDFDPVKAKMDALAQGADNKTATISAMATISGQSQDELASLKANRPNDYQRLYDIADAFPSEMVDGVPLGWEYLPIADKSILTIIKPSIDKFDGEKEYIATANVSQNNIVGNLEKITYKKRPSRANMQPIIGSIWFAKMVGEHKAIMIDKDDDFLLGNTVLSTGFLGIMPNKNLNSFLYCYINSEKFLQDKYSLATGAVQVALNNTNFSSIELLIPNDDLLQYFENATSVFFAKIASNNRENIALSKIRDGLLPKLLSGEIEL